MESKTKELFYSLSQSAISPQSSYCFKFLNVKTEMHIGRSVKVAEQPSSVFLFCDTIERAEL